MVEPVMQHGMPVLVVLVCLVLGLRHAGDPDHLAAITGLLACDRPLAAAWHAGWLGLWWGLGHASALLAVGLPLLWLERQLPLPLQQLIELTIAGVTIWLALRLIVARRRVASVHQHASPRSVGGSFGIGLLHGLGGSGGLTLLVLTQLPDRALAYVALLSFAVGSTLSMVLMSAGLGWALRVADGLRRWHLIRPVLGWALLLFGVWYAWQALASTPAPH